ncbi:hypothetical protein RIF29_28067 [Crotalaria pallida]|uniref:Germin-like protein n=1 Tax=Crotalaria pallida TaxID=3830 RepID=A0AAN9ER84_CROPI
MIHVLFFLFAFLLSTTSHHHVVAIDFCVADLKGAETPSGYPCKPLSKVTIDDFVFSKFPKPTKNFFNFSAVVASVDQFPALNGLGFSIVLVEIEAGASVPLHTHPDATEVIIAGNDNIIAGFISSADNKVFVKTLSKGNIMVLPQGLLHFVMNNGKEKASLTVIFTSVRASVQTVAVALFASNFDSNLISKTTFLDHAEIKKLKGIFNGSG